MFNYERKEENPIGGWNFIDRTGMTFGKLKVQKYLGNRKWLCHCECGNDCIVSSGSLSINGKRRVTKSCGCLKESRLIKNLDFFDIIDTEEKAYILGFLASDGCVIYNEEKKAYYIKVVVNSVDRDLLVRFKEAFGTDAEVKTFKSVTHLPQGGECESEMSSLLLCSKPLTEQLIKYGVTPKKSLTLDVDYSLIPDELKRHFWRGLFDGDGTFGLFGKKKILEVSLTTSKAMAEHTKKEILKIFPESKIGCYLRKECSGSTYNMIFTTQKDGMDFLAYMYENSNIKLERKYQKYLEIKNNS